MRIKSLQKQCCGGSIKKIIQIRASTTKYNLKMMTGRPLSSIFCLFDTLKLLDLASQAGFLEVNSFRLVFAANDSLGQQMRANELPYLQYLLTMNIYIACLLAILLSFTQAACDPNCIDNCFGNQSVLITNTTVFTCKECNAGYTLLSNACFLCQVSNCQACSSNNTCSTCVNSYTLGSNKNCIPCNVANCQACTATNVCGTCNSGYTLSSNTCNAAAASNTSQILLAVLIPVFVIVILAVGVLLFLKAKAAAAAAAAQTGQKEIPQFSENDVRPEEI